MPLARSENGMLFQSDRPRQNLTDLVLEDVLDVDHRLARQSGK
jgi:hypothetical protein